MPVTVLSVAFPYAPVRDDVSGGAEQVLLALDSALVEAGHRSIVIASGASIIRGTLIPTDPKDYRHAIESAIRTTKPDIVHYHGLDFRDYMTRAEIPTLVTLHMPASFYEGELPVQQDLFYHCVSDSQRSGFRLRDRFLPTIENGVDTHFFRPRSRGVGSGIRYAVSLGRICPEKGYHLALDAAREARIALILAGEAFPYPDHQAYLRNQIEPRLDCSLRFIGPVGRWRKRRLLLNAQCLVIPSLVNETSSLVAMEALACGTPVVARPVGALPDIIEHGRTGYLAETTPQLAKAVAMAAGLDRYACRRAAEGRFSQTRMTARYMETYHSLVHQPCSK